MSVVIGPLADAWREMRGPWAAAGYEEPSVTVLAGLREALPNAKVVHAEGVTISDADASGIASAVDLVRERSGCRRSLPRRSGCDERRSRVARIS